MIRSITHKKEGQKEKTLLCTHWKNFPPKGHLQGSSAEQWRNGTIDSAGYSRLKVWEDICAKREMDSGCLDCPHHREIHNTARGPVTVDPKGVVRPLQDSAKAEALGGPRPTSTMAKPLGFK